MKTAFLLGVIAFHETLNGRNIVGIILILLAVCILAIPINRLGKKND